jgi:acyl-CoA dehydrogenase
VLKGDYILEKRSGWDALGMRGTCSEGFRLSASGAIEQVMETPFAEIADTTMLPVSHILWAACWVGIASDAVDRARKFCRAQARAKPGAVLPGGARLTEAVGLLQLMQSRLAMALNQMTQTPATDSLSGSLSFASDMNTLKLSLSVIALSVVQETLMICGMAGYKNGTPFSLGRHLRDLQSAPLMINNDRIAANTANLLLAQRSTLMRF